jgi:pre-mRNA-processing factor 19
MICALSGEAPEEPVVSIKSGHVFEKRVIVKYLEANNNKDPFSEDSLSLNDLIPLKVNKVVKPRPITATSIPSLLQIFQNEWDALMLETYSLKEQLENVRQELSHALYQHDAACRVIARLIKERDEARNALINYRANAPAPSQGAEDGMEVEAAQAGLSESIKAKMNAKSQELSKDRKKRTPPEDLATMDEIKDYQAISTHNVHKASPPGVTCLDIHPLNEEMVVTGGADTEAILFNRVDGKVVSHLTGHSKAITDVLFHPAQDFIFTTSKDKTAKVWRPSEQGHRAAHTVTAHENEVVGCTLHATGDYWVTGSLDGTWAFHDLETSNSLVRVNAGSGISCVNFHPDGLILGAGTVNSDIKIWDTKSLKNVATFEGHIGKVVDLSFSENGYYLATAAQNTVKLWDLRKLKNFHSLDLPEGVQINAVSWDYSGTYLAVAADDIRVFSGKALNHIATYNKHTKAVTDVKWGSSAKFLASTSMDRSLKFWGIKDKK